MLTMYNLYHNKEKGELKLIKVSSSNRKLHTTYKAQPSYFNDCYYVCMERKPLKELAISIKEQWLKEAKERVEMLENMKV